MGKFPDSPHGTCDGVWHVYLAAGCSNSLQEGKHTDGQVQETGQVRLGSGPMETSRGVLQLILF